ncbi:major facilitator superfamily domain-containing protein [Kockovaella imperatae]|uniref:Major facilitator superfamily domain-containing protein n=1 Tax=Kockovaella imperatae TaxID=4999 RepID=A0A1Y1UBR2_9TREE|nr:major facilitator superfamily domain-containing protein [Kockovaella imperatae]ORX34977.1 major facilitator superfamily domain-containing protein [Kockovaella imperatae]
MSTPEASTSTLHGNEPVEPAFHRVSVGDLPPGCSIGPELYDTPRGIVSGIPKSNGTVERSSGLTDGVEAPGQPVKVIWVEFPPGSPDNPFSYTRRRKIAIMFCALFFAFCTALQGAAYAQGIPSMTRDLGTTEIEALAGVSLYPWGFALGPLVLAPITEEYGRYWAYVGAVAVYTLLHLTQSLAQNTATVLVGRFLMGLAGCIGSTVVAGTVSDLYMPEERGAPMALFTLCVVSGTGFAALFAYVEANPHLQWRWIGWIQLIILCIYFVVCILIIGETRAPILLRRRAKKLRESRGEQDGGRYTARSEVDKPALVTALKTSLKRPIMFLLLEPVVTFFGIWLALVWGVFFIEIAGISYVFENVFGFGTSAQGSVFWCFTIGGLLGYLGNFYQDSLYRKYYPTRGVEARLYAPMASGILFAVGSMIFGLTSVPTAHWIGPCIGITLLMTGAFAIYQTGFLYLSQCYGTNASSAIAGMSFLRIIVGSSFAMFTNKLFESMTPRWGLFLMGCIGLLLAPIPFVAYYYGPWIRERSPYSKILIAEEKQRVEAEMLLQQKTEAEVARVISGQSMRRNLSRGMSRAKSRPDPVRNESVEKAPETA